MICTWLLVMSGTASIGSWRSAPIPSNAAAIVRSRTSQRFSTERVTMRPIMAQSSSSAVPLPSSALSVKLLVDAIRSEPVRPDVTTT